MCRVVVAQICLILRWLVMLPLRHFVDRFGELWRGGPFSISKRRWQRLKTRLRLEPLEPRRVLNGDVIISEIMARNDDGLLDHYDQSSDWIELTSTSANSVDLQGRYLTDDPDNLTKWQVPVATTLDPGQQLTILASGRNLVAPDGELHTNFQLGGGGEYLALVASDGQTIQSEFDASGSDGPPGFPPQFEDVSYGVPLAPPRTLVTQNGPIEWLVPVSADQLDPDWHQPDFTDPSGLWTSVASGGAIGFDVSDEGDPVDPSTNEDYTELIQTDLAAVMHGQNASAFVRAEFEAIAEAFEDLILRVRDDDGFIAYLNGVVVAHRHAPATAAWNSAATARRDDNQATIVQEIPLTVGSEFADFHRTPDGVFLVDLPNGPYDVRISQGDLLRVRDEMVISLEGASVDTVRTESGQIAIHTYPVEIQDGQLTLGLSDAGGVTGNAVINSLVITSREMPQDFEPLRFDFGTDMSPVTSGFEVVDSGGRYLPAVGYGWLPGDVLPVARKPNIDNLDLLTPGTNVLAVQGLNLDAANPDFLLEFELEGSQRIHDVGRLVYFAQPTPGEDNVGRSALGVSSPPQFSVSSRTITGKLMLELTADQPGSAIVYTTDGSEPNPASTLYSGPIAITETTRVRARTYDLAQLGSETVSETYLQLSEGVQTFTSDLPIVVLDSLGAGTIPTFNPKQPVFMAIFEPGNERSSLTNEPDVATRAGFRIRGSSSQLREKKSYRVETWNEQNNDVDIGPFGMPEDSDWILFGPFQHDRALIRNNLIYELSNQLGRYAARTQFVELYVNSNGGPLRSGDYVGLYSFMETIKRGSDRVDVERLWSNATSEPDITGGYIMVIDHLCWVKCPPVQEEEFFETPRRLPSNDSVYIYNYPDKNSLNTAQKIWVRKHFGAFEDALYGPDFIDPELGYADFIDVDSFVDGHWLGQIAKNEDNLVHSTYFYKPRGGKLIMGPTWDHDQSMSENPDLERSDPEGWHRFIYFDWWGRLFEDRNFERKWIDRWFELRKGQFSVENIHATIDGMADEIREAQARNFQRWPQYLPRNGDWQVGEINRLKQWFVDRVAWIDEQFLSPPEFNQDGGLVTPGFNLTVTHPDAIGTAYYTSDGTDPRLSYSDVLTMIPDAKLVHDFNATAGATFLVDIPNGTYDVTIKQGDLLRPRDQTVVILEGIQVGGGTLDTEAGEIVERTSQIEVTGGQLTLTLRDQGGATNNSVINSLEIRPEGGGPAVMAFDFGTDTSPVEDGFIGVHKKSTYTAQVGYGWTAGSISERQQVSGISPSAQKYTGAIPLDERVTIGARVLKGSDWSAINSASFVFEAPVRAGDLSLTELNYNPYEPLTAFGDLDGSNNDDYEYLELVNINGNSIDLQGAAFTDGIDFVFGPRVLQSGERVLVVRNIAAFEARYGTGHNVAGEFTVGSLSNNGENIRLEDVSGAVMVEFNYGDRDAWPGLADGKGATLEVVDPAGDYSDPDNWRSSQEWGGSPGTAGTGPISDVILNEILSQPHGTALDQVELYNRTDHSIDLTGWYVSNDSNNPRLSTLPSDTMIDANEYLVLDESQLEFSLDGSHGGDLWLVAVEQASGKPLRFADHVNFDATDPAISLGRWSDTDPTGTFFPMVSQTFGSANSGPLLTDVIISEIHYNPGGEDAEFVELLGISPRPTDLDGWKLNDAVDYTFASSATIGLGEVLVVVGFDPADSSKADAFRTFFGIDSDVQLVGPYLGTLNNSGASVQLMKPLETGDPQTGFRLVDLSDYDDQPPWPSAANGMDRSLYRTAPNAFGNFAASWLAKEPTPGSVDYVQLGDLELDGDLDFHDINEFVLGITDPTAYQQKFGVPPVLNGDMEQDGDLDFDDIDEFVALISGDIRPEAGGMNADGNVGVDEIGLFVSGLSDLALYRSSIGAPATHFGDYDWDGDLDFDDIDDFFALFPEGDPKSAPSSRSLRSVRMVRDLAQETLPANRSEITKPEQQRNSSAT